MASSILVAQNLGISYKIGVNSEGLDVFKGQSFDNIKAAATDTELVGFVDIVENILAYNVSSIKKQTIHAVTRA